MFPTSPADETNLHQKIHNCNANKTKTCKKKYNFNHKDKDAKKQLECLNNQLLYKQIQYVKAVSA